MDLHLAVGGLLTRDPVLGTLLLNYAAHLGSWCTGSAGTAATSFIVPSWPADPHPPGPTGGQLFSVEAHVPREAAHRRHDSAAILDLVDAVLTDGAADGSVQTRRLPGEDLVGIGPNSVFTTATWLVAPALRETTRTATGLTPAAHRRLAPRARAGTRAHAP